MFPISPHQQPTPTEATSSVFLTDRRRSSDFFRPIFPTFGGCRSCKSVADFGIVSSFFVAVFLLWKYGWNVLPFEASITGWQFYITQEKCWLQIGSIYLLCLTLGTPHELQHVQNMRDFARAKVTYFSCHRKLGLILVQACGANCAPKLIFRPRNSSPISHQNCTSSRFGFGFWERRNEKDRKNGEKQRKLSANFLLFLACFVPPTMLNSGLLKISILKSSYWSFRSRTFWRLATFGASGLMLFFIWNYSTAQTEFLNASKAAAELWENN